jgi:hypothetical protein
MVRITLRLTDETHKALVKSAESNHRSMNGEIQRAIEYYLKNAPESHYEVKTRKESLKKPSPK